MEPRFDYRCTECGHEFKDQPRASVETWPCDETPGCEGHFRRKYAFGGFILKGSGWAKKS